MGLNKRYLKTKKINNNQKWKNNSASMLYIENIFTLSSN